MTRTSTVELAPLLGSAHRMIRVLEADEGPFRGVLVTAGETVAVRRDAVELSGWDGWRFAGSEHVAGPLDLVRRADGHDVLLPWCTERVGGFLARRSGVEEPLTPGECSTLVVSLLRALAELGANECADVDGTWWLTDDGRPVFVIGEGEPARSGVAALVARLGEQNLDRALGRLIAVMHAGLARSIAEQPGIPQLLLERWETEMLEIATPRALRRGGLTGETAEGAVRRGAVGASPDPRRVMSGRGPSGRELAQVGVRERSSRRMAAIGRGVVQRFAGVTRLVARFGRRRDPRAVGRVPAVVRDGVASSAPNRTGRRRPMVLAGAAAALVLVVGILWPSADDDDAAVGSSSVSVSSGSSGTGPALTPTVTPSASAAVEDVPRGEGSTDGEGNAVEDPVLAAAALWQEIVACKQAEDAACADAVMPGAVGVIDAVGAEPKTPPKFAVIDQYGDIAVVRAEAHAGGQVDDTDSTGPETSAGKVLVLARLNEKWLVRDVYDVADQPG